MDLYYNEQKVASLPVTPEFTIGHIKTILRDWLTPQGVTQYSVRLLFNNGTELSSVVFETDTYNDMNFQAQATLLAGGSIHVLPVPQPKVVTPASPVPSPKVVTTTTQTATLPSAVSPTPTEYTITTLNALKIPELKNILKNKGLKLSGKKAELIDRILGTVTQAAAPKLGVAQSPINQTEVPNSGVVQSPINKPAIPEVPLLPAASPISPMSPLGPLATDFPDPFAGTSPLTIESPLTIGVPEIPDYEDERGERVIYIIKDDNDDYMGFTTKTRALRYWVNNEFGGDVEDIGLYEPIDYDDDDVQESIEQMMEDADYSLISVDILL